MKGFRRLSAMLITLVMLCSCVCTVNVSAAITEDGLYRFNLYNGEATVIEYLGSEKDVQVPKTMGGCPVVKLAGAAFRAKEFLETVIVPPTVTTIGERCFSNCSNLRTVVSAGAKTVERSAFRNCASLTSITLGEAFPSVTTESFDGCEALEELIIGEGVEVLGEAVFRFATNLKRVVLPSTVERIEDAAFLGCTTLEEFVFSDSVTHIGSAAFKNCSALKEVVFPEELKYVGTNAFEGCSSLETVKVNKNIKTIDWNVFLNCNSIKNVYISDLAAWCGLELTYESSQLVALADNVYIDGEKVTTLIIPEGVKKIGWGTFRKFKGLKDVIIPDTVKKIDGHAFEECTELERVNFPDSVTTIGVSAFNKCSSLKEAKIPARMKELSYDAFRGTALEVGHIPAGVGYDLCELGSSIYRDCPNMKTAVLNSMNFVNEFAGGMAQELKITHVIFTELCTQINFAGYFGGCDSVVIVTLPKNMNYLREDAFRGCDNLSLIVFQGTKKEWDELLTYCHYDSLRKVPVMFADALIVGDTNLDAKLNVQDATALQKHLAGIKDISLAAQQIADVNGDSFINIKDATQIQKNVAGIK